MKGVVTQHRFHARRIWSAWALHMKQKDVLLRIQCHGESFSHGHSIWCLKKARHDAMPTAIPVDDGTEFTSRVVD